MEASVNIYIKSSSLTDCPERGECVFVYTDYDPDMVEVFKSTPCSRWSDNNKCWELLKCMVRVFIRYVRELEKKKNIKYQFFLSDELKSAVKDIHMDKFTFVTTPYKYQKEGVEYMIKNPHCFLGDEPGSGKTKQVIDLARYLKKFEGVKHVLIICGVNGNKFNWINEIEQHSEFHGHILGSRISKRTGRLNLGTMKDVVYDLRNLPPEFFYIINIEKLRGLHQKRKRGQRKSISEFPIAELIQSLIDKREIGLVAVDEIHKVKSPTAIQSQALMWINCPRQVGMSGTLVINSPLDLYVPFKWMGFETRDYYHYQSRYAIKDFWGSVIGYQHAQEMMDVLACYQLRRLRKDILDLPPKIHVNEYIEMSEAENKFYSAVQNGLAELYGTGSLSDFHSDMSLKADLFEKLSNIDNPLVLSLRLRQVTADTSLISDDPVPSSKMQRMEELVEEEVENGGKCIIFSNWSQVTEIAKKRLIKYQPAYITGQVKDDARFREMKRFQEDSSCKVIIGTIDALGTGFSLDAATQVIFLDEPWTQATKTQAEDRAYRAVTKHSVRIVTLIDKWTVDEHVHDIVEGKGAVADLIVDGVVNKNKKDELTRLLLGFDKFKLGSKKSVNKKGGHK